jgi:2-phosphosulfolactate phosphatase
MKLELYFTPAGINGDQISGKTSVVIDILRATTVAAVALHNGARDIIPMASIGDASSMKQKLDHSSVILGGERHGQKVEGFDLGNSPFEYSPNVVENKSIILASTNGSGALIRGSEAKTCFSCAFINISAIFEKVIDQKEDIAIICAGNKGGFSLEDALCGGMLVYKLKLADKGFEPENDAAWIAMGLYEKHKDDLAGALRESDHGKFLVKLGFEQDIAFCAKEDHLNVAPLWQSGRLILNN